MSIHIYPFSQTDVQDLVQMHLDNNSPFSNMHLEALPKTGFIVRSHDGKPIAAGFLRLVEGGTAQLDTLITNPSMTSQERNDGLDLLVQTLIITAKSMNIIGLMCTSTVQSILMRSQKYGFTPLKTTVIVLSLI